MRIQFCGANRTVTGSCHLIEVNGMRIFLDMGMYQGPREQARRLNNWLPDDAKTADAIILSHGHLDHCGKIPVLTRSGFAGPIYCTPATAEVARVVLQDAAEIQEEDVNYLNRRQRAPQDPPVQPLYVSTDIPVVLRQMRRTRYGQKVELGPGVWFTFYDAGHILGSAYVVLEWKENNAGPLRTLLFTADVGRYDTPIIRDPQDLPHAVDFVITESTYGAKHHAPMSEVGPQLLKAVQDCIQRRSRLIVPAFAVGRTQTILWYMQRFIQNGDIPQIPVHVDSPMGVEISRIHAEYPESYDEETKAAIGHKDLFGTSRVNFARSSQDSRKINGDSGPCVIIASSPTCEFGRVLHHLKLSIERKNDIVVFVGWTPPNTLGRRLQGRQERVRIYDRWYNVACDIRTLHGLSAHADCEELIRFLRPTIGPQTQFHVVHGEEDQSEVFAMRLLSEGASRVNVPAMESAALSL